MEFDHIVEKKQEQRAAAWLKLWSNRFPELLSMQLAEKHRSGETVSACLWESGAFNICYRVRYDDRPDVIVRFASLGRAILRREKVQNEVATMKYIRQTTSITVPEVFGSGICWAAPYIVMPALNPQISDRSLRRAYREMGLLLLELSKYEFDAIGALQKNEGGFSIARRPLTFNMNDLMVSANLPKEAFTSHTFRSATDYFETLAMQHFSHLQLQQRDIVSSKADRREKSIARCLFLNLTKKLCAEHPQEPFRLYCDDFRPSNVLIHLDTTSRALRVSGVINWEFTYAAPAEFTYVAPWWLLLQSPEDWGEDLNQFLVRFSPRLRGFLEGLSQRMEHSMETGLFWICLVARYSSMFDEIYWTFIDQRCYGNFTSVGTPTEAQESFDDHYPIDKLLELLLLHLINENAFCAYQHALAK
ncbi:hypothetical protein BDW42DRAFT_199653 [Aspergillus taichungensis]|uniref:Aminoglycoside phosphotransferase domain-containing protein n=1 Tax=Aspergillus taichungensis TaxID=482145 RepID=A0A2J5HDW8_9EURO|nr:hypothetical protein BDW42DRAFT_199653 [Aspergillus taichungensis]